MQERERNGDNRPYCMYTCATGSGLLEREDSKDYRFVHDSKDRETRGVWIAALYLASPYW